MSLTGEKSLERLLRSMQPTFLDGTWAYVTVPAGRPVPQGIHPLATFREPEGLSLLISEVDAATCGLPTAFFCRGISLNVHSSLYAIGFLAAVSERLRRAGMSINIISAYYRDYIFVPTARAEEALAELKKLALE